jgi:hypothetical protein
MSPSTIDEIHCREQSEDSSLSLTTITTLTLFCTYPSSSSSLSDSFAIDPGQPAFALSWRQNQNRYQDYLALEGERALASFPRAHKRENGPQKNCCMAWHGMDVHHNSKDIYYVSVESDNTTKIQRVETRPPDLQCMHACMGERKPHGRRTVERVHTHTHQRCSPTASEYSELCFYRFHKAAIKDSVHDMSSTRPLRHTQQKASISRLVACD